MAKPPVCRTVPRALGSCAVFPFPQVAVSFAQKMVEKALLPIRLRNLNLEQFLADNALRND
jgi:hypothetical protein